MKYSITFLYLQNINERNDTLNLTDICLTGCTRKRGASERRRWLRCKTQESWTGNQSFGKYFETYEQKKWNV